MGPGVAVGTAGVTATVWVTVEKTVRVVVTVAKQISGSAIDDRGTRGTRTEEHRQNAKEQIVREHDVGGKVLQDTLQALVLVGHGICKDALEIETRHL